MSHRTLLQRLANVDDPASLANRLRTRRFRCFEQLASRLPRPLRILDVGGTPEFWARRGWGNRDGVRITTVNLAQMTSAFRNITPRVGNATNLSRFGTRSFDIAFSNSVIEHLGSRIAQAAMACEMRRVSDSLWLQTPNFWFPVEPHFHVPGWQWLPRRARVEILRRRRCGWRGPCPDPAQAAALVDEVQLLGRRQLARLFPGAAVIPERFAGLVKSWIVVEGFDGAHPSSLQFTPAQSAPATRRAA